MQAIAVNLSIVQRSGDPHALCFLDQARYLRHYLGRLGIPCLLSKNRLYRDRLNVVFGAHKGFDPKLAQVFPCVIFNLEQIGRDGANLTEAYLDLLKALPSLDYDSANQSAYASTRQGPLVRFLDAPYLRSAAPAPAPPLSQRPIELLFFGSINERRRHLIGQIEAAGCAVTMFDQALYGPERDTIIVQAKAVLNLHFYESGRIEQARISHCLSLGTPVISERKPAAEVPAEFEDAVFWQPADAIAQFLRGYLATPQFQSEAEEKIRRFRANDPLDSLRPLAAFLEQQWRAGVAHRRDPLPAPPRRMNLGCGNEYLPGWINVDACERFHPDVVLDLSKPTRLPVTVRSPTLGEFVLDSGCLEAIYARGEFVRAADFAALMTNALELLEQNGILAIEIPYRQAGSWQDPIQVRALSEESFRCCTDSFWNMGWFTHRFAVARLEYLDPNMAPCARELAGSLRVLLRKVATTAHERMRARVLGPDFGPGLEGESVTAAAIARAARALQEAA